MGNSKGEFNSLLTQEQKKERGEKLLAQARCLTDRIDQPVECPPKDQGMCTESLRIDAAFLFRFDPLWYDTAETIRKQVTELFGQVGSEAPAQELAKTWTEHMNRNCGLNTVGAEVYNNQGLPYHSLDKSLNQAPYSDDESIKDRWLAEAAKTMDIREKLRFLADEYNLIPANHEPYDWGPNHIELQLRRISASVLLDKGTCDLFRWPEVLLVEQPEGKIGGARIRPQIWGQRWVQTSTPTANRKTRQRIPSWQSMYKEKFLPKDTPWQPVPQQYEVKKITRVRTWTVYYLSERGGGNLTEDQAVATWNDTFIDSLQVFNFRTERGRLIDIAVTRGHRERLRKRRKT